MDEKIHNELKSINEKLDSILELLKNSKESSDKMTDHIDFVESVYTTIKNPLNSIIQYVQGSNQQLPSPRCLTEI